MTAEKKIKERLVQDIGELMADDDGDLLELALKMMTLAQLEALKAAILRPKRKSP